MSEVVEFVISEHTIYNDNEYAVSDAMCNITTLLADMGLTYNVDWKLSNSHYDHNGHKVVSIEFINPSDAMLAKLNGLANG